MQSHSTQQEATRFVAVLEASPSSAFKPQGDCIQFAIQTAPLLEIIEEARTGSDSSFLPPHTQKGFVFRVKILTCNRQREQEPSNPEPSNSPLPSLPPEPSPSGQVEAHPGAANAISSLSQYLLCVHAGRRKLQLHNCLRQRRSADEKQAPPALVSQPWLVSPGNRASALTQHTLGTC